MDRGIQWSGGKYVTAPARSALNWTLAASTQPRLVQPVVELTPGSLARTSFTAGGSRLGTVRYDAVGKQGNAPAPTELIPIDLRRTIGPRATTVSARTSGGAGAIDALLVMPEVATLTTEGGGHATALLTSKSGTFERRVVALAGSGRAVVSSYDRWGRLLSRSTTAVRGPRPGSPRADSRC